MRTERKQMSLLALIRIRRKIWYYRLIGLILIPGKMMEQVILETILSR